MNSVYRNLHNGINLTKLTKLSVKVWAKYIQSYPNYKA